MVALGTLLGAGAVLPSWSADAATSKFVRLIQTAGKKKPKKSTTATKAKATAVRTATVGEKKPEKKDGPRVAAITSLPSFAPISSLAVEPQPALAPIQVKPIAAPLPVAPPAPAPLPSATPPVDDGLPDTPDDQLVLDVIRQNLAGVRACYLRLQRAGVQVTGKALVTFLVSADGRATELQVDAPTFGGTTLPACVTQQISHWAFPKSHRGISAPITYPFVFVGS